MREDTNASTSTPDRLDTLLDQLTLAEQVSLLAGAAFWTTVPIPRLNIPALKVSDGPAGARAAEGEDMLAQESRPLGEVMWFDLPAGVPSQFRARLTSTLSIAEAGHYELSLASAGLSRLLVDGEELIENWENQRPGGTYGGLGSDEVRIRHLLSSGEHAVVIEFASQQEAVIPLNAVRFGFRKELPGRSVQDAARLAAEADYAVVCIGPNGDWETEGVDRWGLALPGRQDELVREVARANPNTIVLLQTGGPVLTIMALAYRVSQHVVDTIARKSITQSE